VDAASIGVSVASTVGLVVSASSSIAETVRGGILATPRGQPEAAILFGPKPVGKARAAKGAYCGISFQHLPAKGNLKPDGPPQY
jgi:hypothetical protein